jgi:hypothetical protein
MQAWAKQTLRDENEEVYSIWYTIQTSNKKKKKKYDPTPQCIYMESSSQVPRNIKQAIGFDKQKKKTTLASVARFNKVGIKARMDL